eukprot:6187839-Ditylum_brightwellii.AAC.1
MFNGWKPDDIKALIAEKRQKTGTDDKDKDWKSFTVVASFSSKIAKPILPIHYDSNLPHFDLP